MLYGFIFEKFHWNSYLIRRCNCPSHLVTYLVYQMPFNLHYYYNCRYCYCYNIINSIQINQSTRCNISSSWHWLDFYMYSSTCFGCPHAHHQELNTCSSSLWFYRCNVVIAVLLVVVVSPARTRPTAMLPPSSNGKTRRCYCRCWAPDDGREDTRNVLSCT
jgi:hypothetical protein